MVKRCRHVGGVAERFNGDNRIILPLEAVVTCNNARDFD